MGWSCRAEAGRTLDAFSALCVAQTGQSNVWKAGDCFYMLETSRTEHRDGAITGRVWRFVKGCDPRETEISNLALPKGSVRINPDGTIARGPALLKQASREALARAEETARQLREAIKKADRETARAFFDDHFAFVVVS